MHTTLHRGVRAMAAAAALLALATSTASARPLGSGQDPIDEVVPFNACGYDLRVDRVGTDTWTDKLRGGDVAGFDYLTPWFTSVRGEFTETVTNLDTGKSFQNVLRTKSWDQRLLSIAGDDGSLQTYRRFGTFHRTLYASGQRQYASTAKFSYDYVYDTKGTTSPDDDSDAFIDGSSRFVGNGRDDFCKDVTDYTS